jgi:hypothetical protein
MRRIRQPRTRLLAQTRDGMWSIVVPLVLCVGVTFALPLSGCVSPPDLVSAGSALITEMIPAPTALPSEPIPTLGAPSSEPAAPDISRPPVTWMPVPAGSAPSCCASAAPYAWGLPPGLIGSWGPSEILVSRFNRDSRPRRPVPTALPSRVERPVRPMPRPPAARGARHVFGRVFRPFPQSRLTGRQW